MATAQIKNTQSNLAEGSIVDSVQIICKTKKTFQQSDWEIQPYLHCHSLTKVFIPGISSATLSYNFGNIKREDLDEFFAFEPLGLIDRYVSLWHEGDDQTPLWTGFIPSDQQDLARFQDETDVPTGRQKIIAVGPEYLLSRTYINRSYTKGIGEPSEDLTVVDQPNVLIEIKKVMPFNEESGFGRQLLGNRSKSKFKSTLFNNDLDDVDFPTTSYAFENRVDSRAQDFPFWSAYNIIEYLLAAFRPNTGLAFRIEGFDQDSEKIKAEDYPLLALDKVYETYNFKGTVLDALAALIDRRRGIVAEFIFDENLGPLLRGHSVLKEAVSVETFKFPKNKKQVELDLDGRLDVVSLTVKASDIARFRGVEVTGDLVEFTATASFGDGTLEKGWNEDEETGYREARLQIDNPNSIPGSSTGIINNVPVTSITGALRQSKLYERAFQWFRVKEQRLGEKDVEDGNTDPEAKKMERFFFNNGTAGEVGNPVPHPLITGAYVRVEESDQEFIKRGSTVGSLICNSIPSSEPRPFENANPAFTNQAMLDTSLDATRPNLAYFGHRIERSLPFRNGQLDRFGEFEPLNVDDNNIPVDLDFVAPMVFVFDEFRSMWYQIDRPIHADQVSANVSVLERDFGFSLKGPYNHVFAHNHWTTNRNHFPITDALTDYVGEPQLDYLDIMITFSAKTDTPIQVTEMFNSKNPNGSEIEGFSNRQILRINVPDAKFRYVLPSCVVGVGEGVLKRWEGVSKVRDDTFRLRQIAAMAKAWYEPQRYAMHLVRKRIHLTPDLGTYITGIGLSWEREKIDTVVETIVYDFDNQTTTMKTGFTNIDFSVVGINFFGGSRLG